MDKVGIGNEHTKASEHPELWDLLNTEFDVKTLDNDTTPTVSDLPSNNGNCYIDQDENICSDVTIGMQQSELSIRKEATAFYTLENGNWERYEIGGDKNPGLEDRIEWKIVVENTGTTNVAQYSVIDQIPWPFELIENFYASGSTVRYEMSDNTNVRYLSYSGNLNAASGTRTSNYGGLIPEKYGLTRYKSYNNWSSIWTGLSGSYYDRYGGTYYFRYGDAASSDTPNTGNIPFITMQFYGSVLRGMTLQPGVSISYTYVTESTGTTVPVEYRDYENNAYVYLLDGSLASIGYGEPQYYSEDGRLIGAKASDTVTIGGAFASASSKKVTNQTGDTAYSNAAALTKASAAEAEENGTEAVVFDNIVPIELDEVFDYELTLTSKSSSSLSNIVFIDRLPMVNDVGAININSARNSAFNIGFADDPAVEVWHHDVTADVWTQLSSGYSVDFKAQGATDAFSESEWDGTSVSGWSNSSLGADSLRVIMDSSFGLAPGDEIAIKFKAKVANPDQVLADQTAWNSFGYRYTAWDAVSNENKLIVSEPAKVGVQISGASISIDKKTDAEGNALAGAVFGIYTDESCNEEFLAEIMTTNEEGIAISGSLVPAVYYVREISAPQGYILSSVIYTADLTEAGADELVVVNSEDIVNHREPLSLQITKAYDNPLAAPLTDVIIKVTGVFYGYGNEPVTRSVTFLAGECDGSTVKLLDGIIPGNTYYVSEEQENYFFTASLTEENGSVVTVEDGQIILHANALLEIINHEVEAGDLYLMKSIAAVSGDGPFTIQIRGKFSDTTATVKNIVVDAYNWNTWIKVDGVIYGETYTIYEAYGGEDYVVTYTDTVITVGGNDQYVTVTNTKKDAGKLTIKKTIDGTKPISDEGSFTVEIKGAFSDIPENSKTAILSYPSYTAEVEGVIYGNTYYVEEVNLDSQYAEPEYTGLTSSKTVTVKDQDIIVTINNRLKETVSFNLQKEIEDNTLNTVRTFTFTLTGIFTEGGIEETITGTVTTSASAYVRWGDSRAVTLELLAGESYTLTEHLPTGSAGDYQFSRYLISEGGIEKTENTNPVSFQVQNGQNIHIKAVNQVKESGNIEIIKLFKNHQGNIIQPDDAQDIYVGLYQGNTLVDIEQFNWTSTQGEAVFSGIPYGIYEVYELIYVNGVLTKASSPLSGFKYSVSGEGTLVISSDSEAGEGPAMTIMNTERVAYTDIEVQKQFASEADRDLLKSEVFKVRLIRKDNGLITDNENEIIFSLSENNWKDSLQNVALRPGDYLMYEVSDNGIWENIAISGTYGGIPLNEKTAVNIDGMADGTRYLEFAVAQHDLESSLEITVEVTNKSNSKRLGGFEVYKLTDNIDALSDVQKTFEFNLYKGSNPSSGEKIATGTIVKTENSSEPVLIWKTPEGISWNADEYLWELGTDYFLVESKHNMFALAAVYGNDLSEFKILSEDGQTNQLAGIQFTVSETVDWYSIGFENHRNTVSGLTVKKQIYDDDLVLLDSDQWLAGSQFTFGIYEKIQGDMYLIGNATVTSDTPVAIVTQYPLLDGQTYYIKEINATPSGRYEFLGFTGLQEVQEEAGMYSFVAGMDLMIVARNQLLPADLAIKIIKHLVDDSYNEYIASEDEQFVFYITNGAEGFYQIVTVPRGSSMGELMITGLAAGTYKIAEMETNWRYTLVSANNVVLTVEGDDQSVPQGKFTNMRTNDKWVSDKSSVTNVMPALEILDE